MSHQDLDGRKVRFNYEYVPQALDGLLRTALFSSLTLRDDCTWTAQALASAGLPWAWSDEATLGERFQAARRIVQCVFPRQQEPAASYQVFTKLLRRWTGHFAAPGATGLPVLVSRSLRPGGVERAGASAGGSRPVPQYAGCHGLARAR